MALKGLKKADDDGKQQEIDSFISGANKRVAELKKSQPNFRRVTFSVTKEVDQDIDDLVVACRVARANRSVILKAAIRHLKTMPADELQKIILEEMK